MWRCGHSELANPPTSADVIVVLQAHEELLESTELGEAACILDTSGKFTGDNVDRLEQK